MAVAFTPGQDIVRGDLDIFFKSSGGSPTNVAEISYSIFYVDETGMVPVEVLISPADRTPVNPTVGEYFAALMVPPTASVGTYRIRWTFRETVGAPQQQTVMEWAVVSAGTDTSSNQQFTNTELDLIGKLRILLRDNNPDRNYRFRPPEHEQDINAYNRVFGYIWEDIELLTYLNCALDEWNAAPPETEGLCSLDLLISTKPVWRTYIMWGAIQFAAMALAFNWTADEFDYSIGGISLSIEKSSKYLALKDNAEEKFNAATGLNGGEGIKQRTLKLMRGLQQPRFGRGIRSAFGPRVARGVLSPRNFV